MSFAAVVRTLCRRVVLTTNDPVVYAALRWLECDPEMDDPVLSSQRIHVEPYRDRYRVTEDGRSVREELTPHSVVTYLQRRLFEQTLEDAPASPLIRAACLRYNGCRMLLVGPRRSGKTALALRLMFAGSIFEGDQHVLVVDGALVARPRPIHLRTSALSLVSEVGAALSTAPVMDFDLGQHIYNFDPRLAGKRWEIRRGSVGAVFLLRPNGGGASSIRRVSSMTVARETLGGTVLPSSGRAAAVASVMALLSRAKGYDLSVGDLHGAARCVESAARLAY